MRLHPVWLGSPHCLPRGSRVDRTLASYSRYHGFSSTLRNRLYWRSSFHTTLICGPKTPEFAYLQESIHTEFITGPETYHRMDILDVVHEFWGLRGRTRIEDLLLFPAVVIVAQSVEQRWSWHVAMSQSIFLNQAVEVFPLGVHIVLPAFLVHRGKHPGFCPLPSCVSWTEGWLPAVYFRSDWWLSSTVLQIVLVGLLQSTSGQTGGYLRCFRTNWWVSCRVLQIESVAPFRKNCKLLCRVFQAKLAAKLECFGSNFFGSPAECFCSN